MKGIHFTIGLLGKSSLLPLCVMAPGCYACEYETQYRARHLGVERGVGRLTVNTRAVAVVVQTMSMVTQFLSFCAS